MERSALYNIKSVIMGHAVADALGVPVEFKDRASLTLDPVIGMRAFGTHGQPAGTWSDDTSMTVAALEAICDDGLNYGKIMQNFAAWRDEGEFTATGETFDIGGTCYSAISNYVSGGKKPLECGECGVRSNGNGSLMRILPFILYGTYGGFKGDYLEMIHDASALTHAHRISKVGCGIYAVITGALLRAPQKETVSQALRVCRQIYRNGEARRYDRLFDGGFADIPQDQIESSGYVIHTLEAAVWCVLNTNSYRECVLAAVNLGDDTDTVGAVAGGLAGALYGYDGIPEEWLDALKRREYLEGLCERASRIWCSS
ncbi:MAG: ADP-ribosylglycohydrolase family protein [Clostridia bacterium]|nr:ADP-ribosylglycohydrolase family protein [Clostridia bacterium]